MTPSTGRTAAWWQQAIERGDVEALEPDEPWAEVEAGSDPADLALSDAQRALLAGLTDQPPVPRLKSLPD